VKDKYPFLLLEEGDRTNQRNPDKRQRQKKSAMILDHCHKHNGANNEYSIVKCY